MITGEHEELTQRILKCAYRVSNTLGCGFLEKVYERAMMVALEREGLPAVSQMPLKVHFDGVLVGDYVADIIVGHAVLLEIKATEDNPAIFTAQVLNYLRATNLPIGLLLNFGRPKLYVRRLSPRKNSS